MNAQENQEPGHIRTGGKLTADASVDGAKARSSNGPGVGQRTQRRALHSIDSNRPRQVSTPVITSSKPKLPVWPSHGQKAPLEAEQQTLTTGLDREPKSGPMGPSTEEADPVIGHKRSATELVKSPRQSEQQESENLAWMDMMLALLEKRYGLRFNLPVNLEELEAANMFQSPQHKRLKADTAVGAPLANNNRTNNIVGGSRISGCGENLAPKRDMPTSLNTQRTSARFNHELEEQAREVKRQRLLLRHAQQIQGSSVSSSTSCGCKTGCLKMYCMCFSSRGFCHAGCGCGDCKNSRTNKTERVEAIQNYLANDPRAFSYAPQPQDSNKADFLHLLPQKSSAVVMRGCRCKKSKCLKKYCECFQNSIGCTSHCRCVDCSNHSESAVAHKHPHLKKASAVSQDKRSIGSPKPFHPVQITVTKQPRRNLVGKSLRLNL